MTEVSTERREAVEAFLGETVGRDEVVLSRGRLAQLTSEVVAHPELWRDLVVHDAEERWYLLLYGSPEYDLWLLSWLPGQDTDWHDHGGSSGSFTVADGMLSEQSRRGNRRVGTRTLAAGEGVAFGPAHVHNVGHHGAAPAVSVHSYSPALTAMTYYDLGPYGLTARETLAVDTPERPPRRSIDSVLEASRLEIDRLEPQEAALAMEKGAVLVDIRPSEYREAEGAVPGAVAIERNVLQWRLDPLCDARIESLAHYDRQIIVMCNEGYASSLAAADLRHLGLSRAADLKGGYRAWKAAGLPTSAAAPAPASSSS